MRLETDYARCVKRGIHLPDLKDLLPYADSRPAEFRRFAKFLQIVSRIKHRYRKIPFIDNKKGYLVILPRYDCARKTLSGIITHLTRVFPEKKNP